MPIYGKHSPDVLLMATSTEEIAAVMKICNDNLIPVTPRGAGTGLAGGCVPVLGGVLIDTEAHALKADGSILPGLYCAGEITGVVHGSNRLGGNAVVDFTVYGSIAGINAAAGK